MPKIRQIYARLVGRLVAENADADIEVDYKNCYMRTKSKISFPTFDSDHLSTPQMMERFPAWGKWSDTSLPTWFQSDSPKAARHSGSATFVSRN